MKKKVLIGVAVVIALLFTTVGGFYFVNKEKFTLLSNLENEQFYDFNLNFSSLTTNKQRKYSKDIAEKIIVKLDENFTIGDDETLESLINAKKMLQLDRDSWQGKVITSYNNDVLKAIKLTSNLNDECYVSNQEKNTESIDLLTKAVTYYSDYLAYGDNFDLEYGSLLLNEAYYIDADNNCSNYREVQDRIIRYYNTALEVERNIYSNNNAKAMENIEKIISYNNSYMDALAKEQSEMFLLQEEFYEWEEIQLEFDKEINNPSFKYKLLSIFY